MATLKERYLTDAKGNRIGIILDTAEYERLIQELEELREREAMRAYKAADDADAKRPVKKSLRDELLKQAADYKAGRIKGKTWKEVKQELALDEDV